MTWSFLTNILLPQKKPFTEYNSSQVFKSTTKTFRNLKHATVPKVDTKNLLLRLFGIEIEHDLLSSCTPFYPISL